jgi:phosphonatase-like hydrolase
VDAGTIVRQSQEWFALVEFDSSMSKIKLVIFDIAGTIIEDHGEVVRAFSRALEKNGIPFHGDELKQWKGAAKREVIRHFIEEWKPDSKIPELVDATYVSFRDELRRLYREELKPVAGADGTFAWLRDQGIKMASTTGFYREESELILESTGWTHVFAANVSSSDVRQGRPAPYMIFHAMEAAGVRSVKEVLNIGDTPLDLQSGANAGLAAVVGVLTGAHDRGSLEREPHTHIIDSVAELPDLMTRAF